MASNNENNERFMNLRSIGESIEIIDFGFDRPAVERGAVERFNEIADGLVDVNANAIGVNGVVEAENVDVAFANLAATTSVFNFNGNIQSVNAQPVNATVLNANENVDVNMDTAMDLDINDIPLPLGTQTQNAGNIPLTRAAIRTSAIHLRLRERIRQDALAGVVFQPHASMLSHRRALEDVDADAGGSVRAKMQKINGVVVEGILDRQMAAMVSPTHLLWLRE